MKLFRSFWFRHYLSRFKWYRKWHGGYWMLWYIDICHASLWLNYKQKMPDDFRQPCGFGTPIIEDYTNE